VGLDLVSLNAILNTGAGQEGNGVLSFHLCCPVLVALNFLFFVRWSQLFADKEYCFEKLLGEKKSFSKTVLLSLVMAKLLCFGRMHGWTKSPCQNNTRRCIQ
jgi:hypothetical protein